MGNCPCLQCLIKKDAICNLGTREDREFRRKSTRKDNKAWRSKVQQARNYVLKGYVVNSAKVNALLAAESYVPNEVCCLLICFISRLVDLIMPLRTHSLPGFQPSGSVFSQ